MADDQSMTEELKERLDIFFGEDDEEEELLDEPQEAVSPLEKLKTIILALEWEITDEEFEHFLMELDELKDTFKDDNVSTLFIKLLESIGKYIKEKKVNAHPDSIRLLNTAFKSFAQVVDTRDMGENERKTLLLASVNKFKELKTAITPAKQSDTPPAEVQEQEISPAEEPAAPAMEEPQILIDEDEEIAPAEPMAEVPMAEPEPEQPIILEDEPEIAPPSILDDEDDEPEIEPTTSPSGPQPSMQPSGVGDIAPHEAFALALQEIKKTIEKEFEALRTEIRLWRQGQ